MNINQATTANGVVNGRQCRFRILVDRANTERRKQHWDMDEFSIESSPEQLGESEDARLSNAGFQVSSQLAFFNLACN